MRRRTLLTILASAALGVGAPVYAQDLPQDLVKAVSPTPQQLEAIDKYVKDRVGKLADEDPVAMKKSRDELIQPFRSTGGPSVRFRQKFAESAMPDLMQHLKSKSDRVVVNSLRVIGEVATPESLDILVNNLKDDRNAVRYAAIIGLERTFAAIAAQTPAMPVDKTQFAAGKLGDCLKDAKTSPEAQFACVRALGVGMQVLQPNFGSLRDSAFNAIVDGTVGLIQRLGNASAPEGVQQVLLQTAVVAQGGLAPRNPELELKGPSVDRAVNLSAHLTGWVFCQIQAKNLPAILEADGPEQAEAKKDARKTAAKIIRQAENNILVAAGKKNVPVAPPNLGSDVEKCTAAGDRDFVAKLLNLINQLKQDMGLQGEVLRCGPAGG